jgi:hypothetical protein
MYFFDIVFLLSYLAVCDFVIVLIFFYICVCVHYACGDSFCRHDVQVAFVRACCMLHVCGLGVLCVMFRCEAFCFTRVIFLFFLHVCT